MYNKIYETIKKYDTIIIHRHVRPDFDAIGAQFGLKYSIEKTFPNKKVYVVGENHEKESIPKMDIIPDEYFKEALSIMVDTCASNIIDDDRYKLAKEVIIIDHHANNPDIEYTHCLKRENASSCAEIIAELLFSTGMVVDSKIATYLMFGIISDSGRFLYSNNNSNVFLVSSKLVEKGADLNYIYDTMYNESYNIKKLRAYCSLNFKLTKGNVAYLINDKHLKEKYGVSTFTVSRGMVNQMAGIDSVPVWVNFTEDDNGIILVEIRSKNLSVINVAQKYGGGGHAKACGCQLKSFDDIDKVLNDLDRLVEEKR